MHDRTIKEKEKKEKMNEKKNVTLGWKPKRAVESENEKIPKTQKTKQIKEWRVNNQKAFETSTRSSIPFKTKNIEPFIQECLS